MALYITIRGLQKEFPSKNPRTLRRWAENSEAEGRPIVWEGKEYHPQKDPGGNWQFKVILVRNQN